MSDKVNFSKRTKILAAVAAALFVICAAQFFIGLKSPQKTFRVKGEPDYISVENSGNTLVLQRNGSDWFCGAQKLDKAKMDSLVKSLSIVKTLNVASRSDSAATLERYGLDQAISIQAKMGAKDFQKILVGKESVSGSQAYVKLGGKKEIYLAQGNLRRDWTFSLDDLKEKEPEEPKADESAKPDEAAAEEITN
ncbi:MAG: DUF4340 domain-containing protein [Treponema sp.]|nr:DUF4340 domain-containing protein [Treponema sp.]MEE3435749.1 DUF4340 domain-containing protein [Treponema sp.]